MNCVACGAPLGPGDLCPNCGTNVRILKKIVATSNELYNKGLDCAKNRDLMQAIEYLESSVQYYKYNTQARNLLGLVYYEIGETIDALSEWVISNNLQPENNLASGYLDKIQRNKTKLETANQSIHKYNQALFCAKKGDLDVAIIQLKKVLLINPKFLKAYQLLALLHIQQNRYDLAARCVRNAERIDEHNSITQSYKRVCYKKRRSVDKKKRELDPPLQNLKNAIAYKSGNDLVILPKRLGDNPLVSTMVTLIAGVVIGIAVVGFLVVPTVRQNMNSDARTAVVDANENLATREQNITKLEGEIEGLNQQVTDAKAETQAALDKNTSYVQLLNAYVAFGKSDMKAASEAIKDINQDYLDEEGKTIYTSLEDDIAAYNTQSAYNAGLTAYANKDYQEAANQLSTVVETDEAYGKSQAAYYLANAYYQLGDTQSAITWFEKVATQRPTTNLGKLCKAYASALKNGTGLVAPQTTTTEQGNGTGTSGTGTGTGTSGTGTTGTGTSGTGTGTSGTGTGETGTGTGTGTGN